MTLDEYLSVLRRRWLAVVLCLLVGIGGGLYQLHSATKQYQASTRLFINIPSKGLSEATQSVQLSQNLLQSYAQVATSQVAQEAVRSHLNLPPGSPLGGTLSALVEPSTLLLRITATADSPEQAVKLANTSATALDDVLGQLSTDSSQRAVVKVIDPAFTPSAPSSPRPVRTMLIAGLLALMAGVGLAALLEALDRSMRTVSQGRHAFSAPGLAVVPASRDIARNPLIALGTVDPLAEPYRSLRTAIRFSDREPALRSLLVTSPRSGEGKSTVAANLAITLTQAGEKVCLVDADLRRSSLSELFDISSSKGVTSIVFERSTLEESLVKRHGITILPAGPAQPTPSELLGSEAFARLLEELVSRFDLVILDGPPVLPVTDSVVLSTQVDGVLLVAQQARTKLADAMKARDLLSAVAARPVGFVLNAARGRFAEYRYETYEE